MPDGDPQAAIAGLRDGVTSATSALLAELEALARIIADARAEVAALRADEAADAFIPAAADELAAIVAHTAQATHEILDTCEGLERLSAKHPAAAAELEAATTRIYEACAFQDITGQRIAKVVKAIQAIEARITDVRSGLAPRATAEERQKDAASLLNGPQLPGAGISQSAIDALFD